MAAPTTELVVSEQFNDSNADITYRSSDGIIFHIHSSHIRYVSGCLLPTEFTPDGHIVDMTEDSSTLELMFRFMRPQPQPKLEKIPFEELSRLAEAVEKYQVYSAMQLCSIFMARFIADHPAEVLDYAVKHGYPDLSNEAAPLITLDRMSASSKSLSPETVLAWVRYYNAWDARRRDAVKIYKQQTSTFHHCERWLSDERDIYAKLANANTPKYEISSLLSLSLDDDTGFGSFHSTCCHKEAKRWRDLFEAQYQSRPLELFTDFL